MCKAQALGDKTVLFVCFVAVAAANLVLKWPWAVYGTLKYTKSSSSSTNIPRAWRRLWDMSYVFTQRVNHAKLDASYNIATIWQNGEKKNRAHLFKEVYSTDDS